MEGNVQTSEKSVTVSFDNVEKINHVVISEEICDENEIESFEIKVYPLPGGAPRTFYKGTTIGHKAICTFPTLITKKIEVVLDKAKKVDIKAYYIPRF